MFHIKKYLSLVIILFLVSCQSEMDEQTNNAHGTITGVSPLTSYLQRVAMVPTVQDNIIDGSSYCTIKLPYTVTVNSQQIALSTTANYQKVLDNINASTVKTFLKILNFFICHSSLIKYCSVNNGCKRFFCIA